MAILAEIRKQTWLLIVVIGIALIAFLAGDLFSENSILRRSLFGDPNTLGEVDGEVISISDYNSAQQMVRNYYQNQNVSENQVSQQAWNTLIGQKLILAKANDLGIAVGDQEFWEYVGQKTGLGSAEAAKQQIEDIERQAASDPSAAAAYQNWKQSAEQIRNEIITQKYLNLVASGVGVTNKEAIFAQGAGIQNAQIKYAFVSYSDLEKKIPVEITDDEIVDYMKKYPKKYKSEPLVKMSYVYFNSDASEADIAQVKTSIEKFLTTHIAIDEANGIQDTVVAFAQAKNDSAYVSRYSETPFISNYFTRDEISKFGFSAPAKEFLSTASVGQVGGPFKEGDSYQLFKISDAKPVTDSVKTSHILIGFKGTSSNTDATQTREEADAKAKELLAQAKANPSNFAALATANSDDKGSAAKGGEIGWVAANSQQLVAPYMNFAKNNPVGTIDIVESEFGFHIIKIDNVKTKTAYRIANISKKIIPSKETTDKSFSNARTFVQDAEGKSLNDFVNLARKRKFSYNTVEPVERFAPAIFTGEGQSADQDENILSWAFSKKTEVGNTNLFTTNTGDYIVVYLTGKYSKGLLPASVARATVEPVLKHEKLAKAAKEKLGDKATIDALVKTFGAITADASLTFSNSNIQNLGSEPKVVGAAFGLQKGAASNLIQGNNGLFVIQLTSKGDEPKITDADAQLTQLKKTSKQKVQQSLLNELIGAADIKDNRSVLFRQQ